MAASGTGSGGKLSLEQQLVAARQFHGSSGVNIPVEIVDTTSATGTVLNPPVSGLSRRRDRVEEDEQDGGDPMDISLDEISRHGQPSLAETLGVVAGNKHHPAPPPTRIEDMVLAAAAGASVTASVDSTQLTPVPPNQQMTAASLTLPGIQTGPPPQLQSAPPPALSASSLGISIDGTLDPHQLALQQVTQHFQEVSRSLRNEGIEISPESLATHFPHSLAEVAASLIGQSSSATTSLLESVINQSTSGLPMDINYADIGDMGRVINNPNLTVSSASQLVGGATRADEIDAVLSESHVPSSPESNFDTSDLFNNTLTQDVELTTKLASAGPVGVAAAAAILSGRKKRRHVFESNPALRKRHCSKLMRKLKETLDELSTRVGLQACVVTYRPSSKQEKPEPAFKVFGTSPLYGAIEEQKTRILNRMDEQLKKQIPASTSTPLPTKHTPYELPPLVFEGIPTPVHEMTQAQLRGFIPTMLKFSTGRGKPGWGKEDMKPVWWPAEVPWQNVRSDARDESQKKSMSWTECLRKTVMSCYSYHGRQDLLQAYNPKSRDEDINSDSARQLQLQLEHHHGIDLSALQDNVDSVNALAAAQDQSLVSDQQQVFTIDTGMGNCDTSGMPTLADASLAETAARLQQVADETSQVQYATQTVTVTERDAKALGQPVGSTTTVLLTAYPSGQQAIGETQQQQQSQSQYYQPTAAAVAPTSASSNGGAGATAPSVQVVYSASHVSEIPDSIVSSIAAAAPATGQQQELFGQQPEPVDHRETDAMAGVTVSLADSNDYFARPGGVNSSDGGGSGLGSDPVDLASQYISGYKPKNILPSSTKEVVDLITAAAANAAAAAGSKSSVANIADSAEQ